MGLASTQRHPGLPPLLLPSPPNFQNAATTTQDMKRVSRNFSFLFPFLLVQAFRWNAGNAYQRGIFFLGVSIRRFSVTHASLPISPVIFAAPLQLEPGGCHGWLAVARTYGRCIGDTRFPILTYDHQTALVGIDLSRNRSSPQLRWHLPLRSQLRVLGAQLPESDTDVLNTPFPLANSPRRRRPNS